MTLRVSNITRPAYTATDVVSLDNVKKHCRIATSETHEDTNLTAMLKAACAIAERETGHALADGTYTFYINRWPSYQEDSRVVVPFYPVTSITSVHYMVNGGWVQLPAASYDATVYGKPVEIFFADTESYDSDVQWPVRIICSAGHAEASVPSEIVQGILMMIATWYDNRQNEVTGTITADISEGTKRLFESVRVAYW